MSAPASKRFLELWGEIVDLGKASSILAWDQETQMPSRGHGPRGKVQSTLAGLRHRSLVSSQLADALAAAAEEAEPGSVLAAQVREAQRIVGRHARVPEALARDMAEARTLGHESWRRAREAKDFNLFAADLAHLIDLTRQQAEAVAGGEMAPYDALLEEYEPGVREADLVPLFDELRAELSPLVKAVAGSGVVVDESPARGSFPAAAQFAFGREVAAAIGFDFEAGRLDQAPHPFCTGFAPDDVRITWRYDESDFRPALFGIMHEAGHGLYEQGLPREWDRTPIGDAVSLGIHESQSRLWENLVGRSRAFWEWALPRFKQAFPGSREVRLEALLPALHTVKPTFIRVEADQGTYDLHVCARFEIERRLFAGEFETRDLPEVWNSTYSELLDLRPQDVAVGVLQDIHWSMGAFGYFPTYTLGNLINAQLFKAAEAELGSFEGPFSRGEFRPLLEWLRDKIHRHGSFHAAPELVELATGRPLSSEDYLATRRASVEEIYGVTVV